jgi:large subunit ribosomal protein L5
MSITKTNYQDNVISSLKDDLGVKSSMAVPKITKVTVNMGLGPDALNNRKSVDDAIADLERQTNQKQHKKG